MSENSLSNIKEGTFAEAILKTYNPLNTVEKFKEDYAEKSFKILLNPKDGQYAALITVDKGILAVEGIGNQNKNKIEQEVLGWDG